MTIAEYFSHYLKSIEGLCFFGVTLGVLLLILLGLYGYSRKSAVRFERLAEKFYELIISGGSILMFMAIYYLINRFFFVEPYRSFWDKHSDLLLLLLIVISIILGRLCDGVLIRLKVLSHEDKSAIRLVSMVYMILIFCYIKFIYENNNYDSFISYFVGIMIGRFVYFDTSIRDIAAAIKGAVKNLPLMIVALLYTAILSFYGFKTGYLIKHIGVVTNVFFIHVFMIAAIFIVFHISKPLLRKKH